MTLAAMRVVVRRGFTHDMADMLLADLKRQLPRLERQPVPRARRLFGLRVPPLAARCHQGVPPAGP